MAERPQKWYDWAAPYLGYLGFRKRSYQLVFKTPAGQDVLQDLMTFCRGNESCVVPGDHDRTLLLEGRREVWLRIQQHLNLSDEQLVDLYAGKHFDPQKEPSQ